MSIVKHYVRHYTREFTQVVTNANHSNTRRPFASNVMSDIHTPMLKDLIQAGVVQRQNARIVLGR